MFEIVPISEAASCLKTAHASMTAAEIATHSLFLAAVIESQDVLIETLVDTAERACKLSDMLADQRQGMLLLINEIAARLERGEAATALTIAAALTAAVNQPLSLESVNSALFQPATKAWPDIFSPKGARK